MTVNMNFLLCLGSFLVFSFLANLEGTDAKGSLPNAQVTIESINLSKSTINLRSLMQYSPVFDLKDAGKTVHIDSFMNTLFTAKASVGSPSQYFTLLLVTTITDIWIPSTQCDTCLLQYDSNASSTYKADGRIVKFLEEDDKQGFLSMDNVCLDYVCGSSQYFVESVDPIAPEPFSQFQGIMGLGMSTKASYNSTSFLKTLVEQKKIPKLMFAFWLNRSLPLDGHKYDINGGEVHLGELNSDRFVEPIQWVPTINNTSWEVKIDKIISNASGIACLNGCAAVLELALPNIFGPPAEINAIHSIIGAKLKNDRYIVACDTVTSLPEITFVLVGKPLNLKGMDYIIQLNTICYSTFAPLEHDGWILGQPVLGSHYSIFDEDELRFGFAELRTKKEPIVPVGPASWSALKIVILILVVVISVIAVTLLIIFSLKYSTNIFSGSRSYREFS